MYNTHCKQYMSRTILRSSSEPSLSGQVASFRKALDLNQEEFAKALGVKRLAVLMWEKAGKGGYGPSIESLVRLAKLAQNAVTHKPSEAQRFRSYARWFWERAGVNDSALRVLVPELEESFRRYEKRIGERPKTEEGGFVPVPLIEEDFAGWDHESLLSQLHRQVRDGVNASVNFPAEAIPLPRATICVRAPDDFMRPIFHQGDFVAVDISIGAEVTPGYAARLFDLFPAGTGDRALAAAYYNRPEKPPRWHGRGGLHLRSLRFSGDYLGGLSKEKYSAHLSTELGLDIMVTAALRRGNLRRDIPEVEESSDIIIGVDPGVSILGRVVAWIGSYREPRREQEPKKK